MSIVGSETTRAINRMLDEDVIESIMSFFASFAPPIRMPVWLAKVSLSVFLLAEEEDVSTKRGYVTIAMIPDLVDDDKDKFITEIVMTSGVQQRRINAMNAISSDLSASVESTDELAFVRSVTIANYRYRTFEEHSEEETRRRKRRRRKAQRRKR
jgi:hypothetical protein